MECLKAFYCYSHARFVQRLGHPAYNGAMSVQLAHLAPLTF